MIAREEINGGDYGGVFSGGRQESYVPPPMSPSDIVDLTDSVPPSKFGIDGTPLMLPPPTPSGVTLSSTQPAVNPSGSPVGSAALASAVDPAIASPVDRNDTQIFSWSRTNFAGGSPVFIDSNGDMGPATAFQGTLPVAPTPVPAYTLPKVEMVTADASSTMGSDTISSPHDDQLTIYPVDPPLKFVSGIATASRGKQNMDLGGPNGIDENPVFIGTQDPYVPVEIPFTARPYSPLEITQLPSQPVQPSVSENVSGVPRSISFTGGGGDSGNQAQPQGELAWSFLKDSANPDVNNFVSAGSSNKNTGASIANPPTGIKATPPSTLSKLLDIASAIPDFILGTNGYHPIATASQQTPGVVQQPKVNTSTADTLTAPNQVGLNNAATSISNGKQLMVAIVIGVFIAIVAHFTLKKMGEIH